MTTGPCTESLTAGVPPSEGPSAEPDGVLPTGRRSVSHFSNTWSGIVRRARREDRELSELGERPLG